MLFDSLAEVNSISEQSLHGEYIVLGLCEIHADQ